MNKQNLIQKIKYLDGLTYEEKYALINLVNTKKKYGLIWEDKIEEVEEQLRESLPVLKEINERAIINEENCPNHILIEGDNLHALTALTFTHEGKIDLIYIDPPYNTGNKDFKYNDSFVDKEDSFRHSKWLSFINKRLEISKRLLSESGVIFISIDDNEQAQLKILCDEIFGEHNFIGNTVRKRRGSQANLSKNISTIHEYILIYGKSQLTKLNNIKPQIIESDYKNLDNDPRGSYVTMPCTNKGGAQYTITTPTGKLITDEWRFKIETYQQLEKDNKLVFPRGGNGKPRYKLFLSEKKEKGVIDNSWWENIATNQEGTIELKEILKDVTFNNPKPVGLITHIMNLSTSNDREYIILDFFAGSGTTLHATMKLNSSDNGIRQCILITNNENNICEEVTYVRNKRVIQGYTNSKGIHIEGLTKNNLRYYQCDFINRDPTLKNKKQLMKLSTELICLKEDCYKDYTKDIAGKLVDWLKVYHRNFENYLFVIYDENRIEESVVFLKELIKNKQSKELIKVYVFSNGQYPYTEDFTEVLSHITLCSLPDAIYKAYQNILPNRKRSIIPEIADSTTQEVAVALEEEDLYY